MHKYQSNGQIISFSFVDLNRPKSRMDSLNIYLLAFIASSSFFESSFGNRTVYEFTKTQNDLTEEFIQSYSDGNSIRDKIWDVLDSISVFNPPTYKIPEKFGNRYFFYGGWNEVFMRNSLKSLEETEVLKRANYRRNAISKDGNFISYTSGYGLKEQIVKNITSGEDIENLETLFYHEFTVSWNKDSTGFIYLQEMKAEQGHKLQIFLKFHKVGTNQSSDIFVADLSPVGNSLTDIKFIQPKLTSDGKCIILQKQTVLNDSDSIDEYLYTEYSNINWKPLKSGNKGQTFEYMESDKTHPNIIYAKVTNLTSSPAEMAILKMDLNSEPVTEEIILDGWKEPNKNRVISDACIIDGDKLVISSVDYLNKRYVEKGILEVKDLKTLTTLYKKTEVASKFRISCSKSEVLIEKLAVDLFKSNYVIDFSKSPLEMEEFNFSIKPRPEALQKIRDYETSIDTYRTKDGSKLPIYIVHRKGFTPQGNSPVVVILKIWSLFSTDDSAFMGMFDGIMAIPMYRQNRNTLDDDEKVDAQTSLDDVISSVEYLIERNYTSPGNVFLTHADYDLMRDSIVAMAVLTRPELFAGVSISDGIFDLVKFTNKAECQKSPVQDTGYCFNQTVLEEKTRMSPLENIKQGVKYPPQLIRSRQYTMEDVHTYLRKLKDVSEGSPVLITAASCKSQWVLSAENQNKGTADKLAFAAKVLGLSWKL